MSDYGIKVSQPGYNVLKATDDQLVMSSKWDTLRTILKGSITINTGSTGIGNATITHNLAYNPAFLIYYKDNAGNYFIDFTSAFFGYGRGLSSVNVGAKVNISQLNLTAYGTYNVDVTVYYELFYQGAS